MVAVDAEDVAINAVVMFAGTGVAAVAPVLGLNSMTAVWLC